MPRQTTFADATAIKAVSSHTYAATFPEDWCIGTVPHGGFVTSCFMKVASLHFSTTLKSTNQPHTIAMHLDFLRRTSIGPAIFKVEDKKVGRQTSVVHITLCQGPEDNPREEVVCYLTQSNITKEDGPNFSTDYVLHPAPYKADLRKFKSDTDDNWKWREKMPFAKFRKMSQQLHYFFPRKGFGSLGAKSMADEWISFNTLDPNEKFTNEALGLVSDAWPQVIETHMEQDIYTAEHEASFEANAKKNNVPAAVYWYPTLLLNLDVKKVLPPEGVEWLFVRVRAKEIKNGRYDLEVVILDDTGDIVALSHHVALALPAARNTAKRRETKPKEAKL